MIDAPTAAGLIAGLIQATRTIGPQWDSLSADEVASLLMGWRSAIEETPDRGAECIVLSIAHHPHLQAAWSELGTDLQEDRLHLIRTIIFAIGADRPRPESD